MRLVRVPANRLAAQSFAVYSHGLEIRVIATAVLLPLLLRLFAAYFHG